jgi:nucleoside 2-deoxyribosyltransferase
MKVYIASPFFNPEQLERVEFIEKLLSAHNIKYFSPRKDTYVKPDSTDAERKQAFNDNLKGIIDCDFVLAVTDGKDVGTIWEAGYAFSADVPVLYFAETLGDKPFNLMLAMSAKLGTCTSRDQLDSFLSCISKYVSVTSYLINVVSEYKGIIE